MHEEDSVSDPQATAGGQIPPEASQKLAELYKKHWSGLCAYIRKQFGSGPPDPEDVAQQVFAKLGSMVETINWSLPKAYLIRMSHNIVISEKRRQAVRERHAVAQYQENRDSDGYDLTPEHVFIAEEEFGMVSDVIARMPEKRRKMLLLNRIKGLSYAEIARQFGVSDTAVKKHVYRAISELDDAMTRARGEK